MKKLYLSLLLISGMFSNALGQISVDKANDLKMQLADAKIDTVKITIAKKLGSGYRFSNIDSSLVYLDLALKITDEVKSKYAKFSESAIADILSQKGATLLEAGKLPESLEFQYEAFRIATAANNKEIVATALNRIGNTYMELGDYRKAKQHYIESKKMFKLIGNKGMYFNEISNIGNLYDLLKKPDSAIYYQTLAYKEHLKNPTDRMSFTVPEIMFRMGNAYKLNGNRTEALHFYKRGIKESYADNDIRNLTMNNLFLAKFYDELKESDSAVKYARTAIKVGKEVSFRKGIYDASLLLSKLYKKRNQVDSAYNYLAIAMVEKNHLMGPERFRELQRIVLEEQELDRIDDAKRSTQRQYALVVGLGCIMIIAFVLNRNNRKNKRNNIILENTVTNLKETQSQLIQSEKMASLGELTAGIAHEIQNPLNFVNNFSEVSSELLDEMNEEIEKGDFEEAKAIAADVKSNLEKINHHGKRADSIVKGMLQHSRRSSGIKELIDLNALCDEYLRLSYHGLRAKDKSFNATLKTDFDESIGKINLIPQDFGRVILNLLTNAFYTVNEKKSLVAQEVGKYEPIVSISTKKENEKITITVSDNGNGMPQEIINKVFQPFFTTKPTGQGTGLGLSMSYDIITKGHGGELKVESIENKGTTFSIILTA